MNLLLKKSGIGNHDIEIEMGFYNYVIAKKQFPPPPYHHLSYFRTPFDVTGLSIPPNALRKSNVIADG